MAQNKGESYLMFKYVESHYGERMVSSPYLYKLYNEYIIDTIFFDQI